MNQIVARPMLKNMQAEIGAVNLDASGDKAA